MQRLENLVYQGSLKLKEAFDLPSPEVAIKIDSTISEDESYYDLRHNLVRVPETVMDSRFIHEYFGHGLFNNYTLVGQRQVSLERNFVSSDNSEEQKQIMSTLRQIRKQYGPIEEGFALWMENVLGTLIGVNGWEQRFDEIKGTEYQKHYDEFSKVICDKGIFTTLYKMGFPKSNRRDIVVDFAKEQLGSFEGLKLLLMYGSGKRDIDLLAVFSDGTRETGLIYDGNIDLNIVNENDFLRRTGLYDIEILEPVLQGRIMLGNKEWFEDFTRRLKVDPPNGEAVDYNKRMALETLTFAEFYLDQHKYKTRRNLIWKDKPKNVSDFVLNGKEVEGVSKDLTYAMNSLTYAISHNLMAGSCNNGTILNYKQMLEMDDYLKDMRDYLKSIENGIIMPKREKVLEFFRGTQEKLRKEF